MKNLFLIIACLISICYSLPAFSQAPLSADSLNIIMIVDPGDQTMAAGDLDFKPTTKVTYKVAFVLNDTTGTAKLHIKMGSIVGSSNYLDKAFVFDQSGSFPDGTAYERQGRVVYLVLGSYMGISSYSIQLRVENQSGQLSSPLSLTNSN